MAPLGISRPTKNSHTPTDGFLYHAVLIWRSLTTPESLNAQTTDCYFRKGHPYYRWNGPISSPKRIGNPRANAQLLPPLSRRLHPRPPRLPQHGNNGLGRSHSISNDTHIRPWALSRNAHHRRVCRNSSRKLFSPLQHTADGTHLHNCLRARATVSGMTSPPPHVTAVQADPQKDGGSCNAHPKDHVPCFLQTTIPTSP